MKIKPSTLPKMGMFSKTSNLAILEEFAHSNYDCVEVEDYPHKNERIAAASLSTSAKKFGMNHIKAATRNGKVYLINTLLLKE